MATNKQGKFDGARCPFSTFLRLQVDHHCACAQEWCHFFQELSNKQNIKALRPKMTKIASKGGGGVLPLGITIGLEIGLLTNITFWSLLKVPFKTDLLVKTV